MPRAETLEFLRFLFASASRGFITLTCLPADESVHLPVDDLERVTQAAEFADLNGQDVYVSLATRIEDLGERRRGKKRELAQAFGLWIDIDIATPGAHAASNLPTSMDEALDLCSVIPLEPTGVVDSGFGVHVYWLLDTAINFDERGSECPAGLALWRYEKALQHLIKEAAEKRGWHMDGTADLTRMLRLPGTTNKKRTRDKSGAVVAPDADQPLCTLIVGDGPRHSIEAVRTALGTAVDELARQRNEISQSEGRHANAGRESLPSSTTGTADASPPSAVPPSAALLLDDVRSRLLNLESKKSAQLFEKVLAGEPFAKAGQRDEMLQRVMSILAFVEPDADAEVLAEIVRPSIEAMAERDKDDAENPPLRLYDAIEKLRRAQEDAKRKKAFQRDAMERMRKALIKDASQKNDGPDAATENDENPPQADAVDDESDDVGLYTDDQLAEFATRSRTTLEGLKKRWVIQKGSAFFVLVDGRYKTPIGREELNVSFKRDLARTPVKLFVGKADGGIREAKPEEILSECATVARKLVSHLGLQDSYYEERTQTFHEAVCPVRKVEPRYDPDVDAWLDALGGSEAGKLKDWTATLTTLEHFTCALIFIGPPGTGKTLYANGVSRLFDVGGPSELGRVLENFNEDLMRCPVVFADEHIPAGFHGRRNSAELRKLIGSTKRTLNRKFLPQAPLEGALRLILASNNERILAFDEDLSADDLAAVAERFLHIDTKGAKGFFDQFPDGKAPTSWVNGDVIAAHALWLAQNRKVQHNGRFLVSGSATRVHRTIATQGKVSGLVAEWITRFLDANAQIKAPITMKKGVVYGDGRLLVNATAITEFWNTFVSSDNVPNTTVVGRALTNLSVGDPEYVRLGTQRYKEVNLSLIFDWAETNLVGDIDRMKATLATPSKAVAIMNSPASGTA